jgi:SAM-dependent methyltransferase
MRVSMLVQPWPLPRGRGDYPCGMPAPSVHDYLAVMAEELGRNPGNLRFAHEELFRGVPLAGRTVLDIGAGAGDASFYAASAGAARVVSLEPEAAGSRGGAAERFARIRDRLGADNVELQGVTLQDYDAGGERFDVLVSMASINHLDEEACVRLEHDLEARNRYAEILAKLASLAGTGADLIVCDATPHNLFPRLGLRNPITPTIEWEKHQPPQLWAELLADAGFRDPEIKWLSFNTLRRPGSLLLGNRFASYLLMSTFRLRMRRTGLSPETSSPRPAPPDRP